LRTKELLARLLPAPPAHILDVGGGPGYYARWLAKRGHKVTLVEPIPLHVEQASEMATRHRLGMSARLGDARSLEFADGSTDVVLEFGPLYHLPAHEDRVRALSEAARVTKPGGLIMVALISRFASLLDGLRLGFIDRPGALAAIEGDLRTGQHRNPDRHPALFTTAYFYHPDEVATDFELAHITLEQLIAVEGPAWLFPDLQERLDDPRRRDLVLQAVRTVETEPRMVGVSAHLMAVGRA
jgi:SAM-dependent methyltransferase